jgi:hypothetical protein
MPVEVVLVVLGLSNGATTLLCVFLWGRVRHLEGVVEGRKSTTSTTLVQA